MIIFGWICTSISRQLVPIFFPSPYPLGFIIMDCLDLVLIFVGCANTFVLYTCRLEKMKVGDIFSVCIYVTTPLTKRKLTERLSHKESTKQMKVVVGRTKTKTEN
ncbi:unnamed protein product [Meloidogyne enterolobii]|uniref:Uncharacterized protein n=1 Tax=Meloidogyne enterolobii TaxID=390850 RepID=A0ACB0Y8X5_MELEN